MDRSHNTLDNPASNIQPQSFTERMSSKVLNMEDTQARLHEHPIPAVTSLQGQVEGIGPAPTETAELQRGHGFFERLSDKINTLRHGHEDPDRDSRVALPHTEPVHIERPVERRIETTTEQPGFFDRILGRIKPAEEAEPDRGFVPSEMRGFGSSGDSGAIGNTRSDRGFVPAEMGVYPSHVEEPGFLERVKDKLEGLTTSDKVPAINTEGKDAGFYEKMKDSFANLISSKDEEVIEPTGQAGSSMPLPKIGDLGFSGTYTPPRALQTDESMAAKFLGQPVVESDIGAVHTAKLANFEKDAQLPINESATDFSLWQVPAEKNHPELGGEAPVSLSDGL